MVLGDFNEILYSHKKEGRDPHPVGMMTNFRDALVKCELEHMFFWVIILLGGGGGYASVWIERSVMGDFMVCLVILLLQMHHILNLITCQMCLILKVRRVLNNSHTWTTSSLRQDT